jgi:hypothetical protein
MVGSRRPELYYLISNIDFISGQTTAMAAMTRSVTAAEAATAVVGIVNVTGRSAIMTIQTSPTFYANLASRAC